MKEVSLQTLPQMKALKFIVAIEKAGYVPGRYLSYNESGFYRFYVDGKYRLEGEEENLMQGMADYYAKLVEKYQLFQ